MLRTHWNNFFFKFLLSLTSWSQRSRRPTVETVSEDRLYHKLLGGCVQMEKINVALSKKNVVCNLVKFTDIESGFLWNIDQSDCLKPKIVQLYNTKLDQRRKNFKNFKKFYLKKCDSSLTKNAMRLRSMLPSSSRKDIEHTHICTIFKVTFTPLLVWNLLPLILCYVNIYRAFI